MRLPKEFRFLGDRVYLKRLGDAVILLPYDTPWQSLVDSLSLFSSDFLEERIQPVTQAREFAFPDVDHRADGV